MRKNDKVSEFFGQQLWLDFTAHFKSETTEKSYAADVGEIMMFSGKDFREIRKRDVQEYFDSMQNKITQKVMKPGTVAKKFRELHSFAKYICENKEKYHTDESFEDFFYPYLKRLEKQKKFAKSIPVDHIDQLLQAAQDDIRAYTLIIMLYRVGLTSTEIIRLKPEDLAIFENGMYVAVIGRRRLCYVPEDAVKVLEKYLEQREDRTYLFYNSRGNQLNLMYISRLLEKLSRKAQIPKYSAVSIRNTCGVNLYAYGAQDSQVATQLGVTRMQVRRYNNQIYQDQLQSAANKLVMIKVTPPGI